MAKLRGALYMNPASGSADAARASRIRAAVTARGVDVVELVPELDLDGDIRARISRGERAIIAAGGDGTIHSVAQSVVGTEAVLGVLPVGTWNHFARDLDLPMEWEAALDIALEGEIRAVDVGRVNDRYFMNNLSLGLYPEIVRHREQFRKLGKWRAYLKASRAAVKSYPHVAISIETPHMLETIRTHVFMVSVNPYQLDQPGVIAPRKTLDGGFLSAYWLPHMPRLQFIRTLARYLRGKVVEGGLRSLQTTQVKVQSSHSSIRVGIDGELRDISTPLNISIVRSGISVRVPRSGGERREAL
ncbi:MAG: diacylglycerol kinase family protein [Thermoanaerobaculia bacterium]